MALRVITKTEAKNLIETNNGTFFSVIFHKRSDGSLRKMVCRKGVKKGTNGEGLRYNPQDYNLINVYDVKKRDYRSIPIEKILSLNIRRKHYVVK